MQIYLKRVYETPKSSDGFRVLVDRLWPRGLTKTAAKIHYWAKAIAPSHELRKWYGHDPKKWTEFKQRYFKELGSNPKGLAELSEMLKHKDSVTFVFSSKEVRLNNAAALKEYLEISTAKRTAD